MQSEATPSCESHDAFSRRLAGALANSSFVRLVLSGSGEDSLQKVLGRLIELKGKPHLSLTFRYATRDETRNLAIEEAVAWVSARLGNEFEKGLLCTTEGDWQLASEGGRARLIRHRASVKTAPARAHDQARPTLLDGTAADWLRALGVTAPNGKVLTGMSAKHAQIARYLEILTHLANETGWLKAKTAPATPSDWVIADMGCGKGYLTFGLWHLFQRVWKLPVQVIGVETRGSLVNDANAVARAVGAEDLRFIAGEIATVPLPALRGLIALHACDTATDDAIARGIELGAELIILAPCCHKQVRPQLTHPDPLAPVLRHGLMEERMAEWITDGLRALFLEWAGYRAKVFEFISSEHTAKNVMIAAVRESAPFGDSQARRRIEELKQHFGIVTHRLDGLLKAG